MIRSLINRFQNRIALIFLVPAFLFLAGCKASVYTPMILSNQDMTLADLSKSDLRVGFEVAPTAREAFIREFWITVDLDERLRTAAPDLLAHTFAEVRLIDPDGAPSQYEGLDLIIRLEEMSGELGQEGGFAWSVNQKAVFALYAPDNTLKTKITENTHVQFFMGSLDPGSNTKIAHDAADMAAKAMVLQFMQDYELGHNDKQPTFLVPQFPDKTLSQLPRIEERNNQDLCRFASVGWLVGKAQRSRDELLKRNLISPAEWALIENDELKIGMSECAALGASYNYNSPIFGVDQRYDFGADNRVIIQDYDPSQINALYSNTADINPTGEVRSQSYVPKHLVTFKKGRMTDCKAVALNRYKHTGDLDKLFPYGCLKDVPGFKKD